MKNLVVLMVLLVTAAARAEAPKKVVAEADAAKFLAFFDSVVDTTVADKDSCDKMATDLDAVMKANTDVIAMANKAKADGKELPEAARKHVDEGVKKMLPALQGCQNNEKVKKAFEKLEAKKK